MAGLANSHDSLWRVKSPDFQSKKENCAMFKRRVVSLIVLSVVAVTPLLSGCHTTAGAGQDIAAGGKAIEKSAKENTP